MIKRLKNLYKLSKTGFSNGQYYESMNWALKRLNNEFAMLHYPLYKSESDSFIQAQKNLTNYCMSLIDPVANKEIIEIGCGNGVQAIYISSKYNPLNITGIDLSPANIEIATLEKERLDVNNVQFLIDDAQNLTQVPSNSVDVLLNIESAFHYPDKSAFLKEISRVLKPNGQFLIADILINRKKNKGLSKLWHKKMIYHFWERENYEEEFKQLNLINNYFEDITDRIIKAYSLYKNWLPKIKIQTFIHDIALRIFYHINVKVNVYLLRKKQLYCIYVGYKPDTFYK